ncbi:SGNH/GDSL hydrolase family protein [Roseobacter sp. HKCCA2468]|uniref:SGNH/GDSL hydrolase family protein n=1 Tax=Roseobacter sp. HKCCA2468 TaxID=3120342 RepID=UPI0030EDFF3E
MSDKRIMCFGDSLTWGWIPVVEGVPTTRYAPDVRWTGVLQAELGAGYTIIEEGLSARTTMLNDPTDPRLDGSAYLPSALASHLPLDLVIIMLGTNDTKAYFHRTPFEVAAGMSKLVGQVLGSAGGVGTTYPAPEVLVVAPPPLTPMPHAYFESLFGGAHEKSAQFAKLYGDLADFMKVHFLNAGDHISTDGVDGIHFTPENNRDLGLAMARKVMEILGDTVAA